MKILYVARHNQQNSSDDEGAIAHAFRELGHEVICASEEVNSVLPASYGCDLCLFHKWDNPDVLKELRCLKAFWYFDLVDWQRDPTLWPRCAARIAWMKRIIPLVNFGFCTDGDWVEQDKSGKLSWLPQGADGRIVGRGKPVASISVLFAGISKGGGAQRESFVEFMRQHCPNFRHVPSGIYREGMRDLVASTDIVVAPDSPVTDNYWSNRVFNMLGFGAFLLHPYVKRLSGFYRSGEEILYYRNRDELLDLIRFFLKNSDGRRMVSDAGLTRTRETQLYVHRCAELIRRVS